MYTDGVSAKVSTEGMIIVVKKSTLRIAREIFSIVSVQEPDCFGGGMKILSTCMANVFGH